MEAGVVASILLILSSVAVKSVLAVAKEIVVEVSVVKAIVESVPTVDKFVLDVVKLSVVETVVNPC